MCQHCWHLQVSSSYFNGGTDTMQCCHCGTTDTRKWTLVRDPKHGPYAPDSIKQYEKH